MCVDALCMRRLGLLGCFHIAPNVWCSNVGPGAGYPGPYPRVTRSVWPPPLLVLYDVELCMFEPKGGDDVVG